jgi:DNA-binding LytR/AlgR family response regulator
MSSIHAAGVRHQLSLDKIIAITAAINYSYVHYTNGTTQLHSRTLKWFSEQFPSLIRIHKASLINSDQIYHYHLPALKNSGGYVVMKNNMRLDVSRRLKVRVRNRLHSQSTVVYN